MVANITTSNSSVSSQSQSFYAVVNYNDKKVVQGNAKAIYAQGILNTNPKMVIKTMESLNNGRVKKPVFHASLNFSKADKGQLTDEKMVEISKDYLKEMGFQRQPVIIYRHHDTEHPHVHIISSRIDIETRKKINDSYEKRRSKEITDQLEKKYNLTISDTQQLRHDSKIQADVKEVLKKFRPENVQFLNKALSESGLSTRARKTKKGLVYYNIDDSGKRATPSRNSSLFKKNKIDFKQIQAQFKQNKNDRLLVKTTVNKVLNTEKNSPAQLVEKLKVKGIGVEFIGKGERVFGVAYLYKGHRYKGSAVDRALSYSNLKKRLLDNRNEIGPKNEQGKSLTFDGRKDNGKGHDIGGKAVQSGSGEQKGLGENLQDLFKTKQKIKVFREGNTLGFNSGNKVVDEKLNAMEPGDAYAISQIYNKRVDDATERMGDLRNGLKDEKEVSEHKNYSNKSGGSILDIFTHEIDEYLKRKRGLGNFKNKKL